MQIKNTYWLKLLKGLTTLSMLCFLAGADIQAQNPVEGYSILQQVVTKTGGGARTLQEGDDGSYYIEYSGSYEDTLLINSRDNILVFDGEFDTIPHRYKKIIKYNKEHEPIAVQNIYSYQDLSIHNSSFKIEKMLYDGGDLFLEMEIGLRDDISRSFYIGGEEIEYGPNTGEIYTKGQIIVVLDGHTLEYKSHVLVQSDGDVGHESWNIKDGFLYFRRTPVNLMVVAQDTFSIEHEGFDRKWINVVKYDYTQQEVVWNEVVATKLPVSGILFFPIYLGLDIDNNGHIFVSLGDMGPPYILANDTISVGEADIGHGAVIVLNTDGEIVRSDIVDGDAVVVDVKTIDDHSFLLAQAYSDFIDYRGVLMGSENEDIALENFVIKVDRDGNYLDHYNTFSGCGKRYNHMRLNKEKNLQLYGQYKDLGDDCNNITNEGEELPFELSGSILTLDKDVSVLSNSLFSAESVDAIPFDGNLSSSGKLVRYNGRPADVQWAYFDEEPFFFEGAEENFRSIILTKSTIVNTIEEVASKNQIYIYPNPTANGFNIQGINSNLSNKTLSIYSSDGVHISTNEDYNYEDVDVSHIPSGTYIIKLISENEITTLKLIKL